MLDSRRTEEDIQLSRTLRPTDFGAFVGQTKVIQPLLTALKGAQEREEPLGHILFSGPPGLGKTTLARIISSSQQKELIEVAGPGLKNQGEAIRILFGIKDKDVLFLDETHGIKKNLAELFYSGMEDFQVSLPDLRFRVSPFTLIGATTELGKLAPPFRDRFEIIFWLDFYNPKELELIVMQSLRKLEMEEFPEGVAEITKRARGTPRLANRLLKRVRDYGGLKHWQEAFDELGIDKYGLEEADRSLLRVIRDRFNGGPVGLVTLSAAWGESEVAISGYWEKYLLRGGFLEKTPHGRVITNLGMEAIREGR